VTDPLGARLVGALDKPGGLNEYGLAAYKTVDGFAQAEIAYITAVGGISIEYGRALGRDLSLSELREQYDAVFLGVGLAATNALELSGEATDVCTDAVDYIARLRQAEDLAELPVGRRIVVIGGGMTAIDIAVQTATKARLMGHEPRVAFLSFSNFGQPLRERAQHVRDAIALLDEREVGFEYDGEMSADVALDFELKQRLYPFCRLSGAANVLIMPALHAANIGAKLLQKLGDATLVGPLLIGLEKPAQVVQMGATVNEIVTAAAIAAHDAIQAERGEEPATVVEHRAVGGSRR